MSGPGCPAKPTADSRGQRVYVWWGAGFGLLLILALVCWLVAGPLLRTDAVLREAREGARAGNRYNGVSIAGGGNCLVYKPEVAEEILRRLGGPEKALPILKLYVRLPDRLAKHKDMAGHALGECGRPAEPSLISLLDHADANVRWDAIWALAQLKEVSPAAVPALIRRLDDSELFIWFEAVVLLGRIGPPAENASGRLLKLFALPDDRGGVKIRLAEALVRIRPEMKDSEEVQKTFIGNFKSVERSVRLDAAWVLGNLGSSAEFAVPALAEALSDKEWNVREASAKALGQIGPGARAAVPALEKALADETAQIRAAAAEALEKIRGEETGK